MTVPVWMCESSHAMFHVTPRHHATLHGVSFSVPCCIVAPCREGSCDWAGQRSPPPMLPPLLTSRTGPPSFAAPPPMLPPLSSLGTPRRLSVLLPSSTLLPLLQLHGTATQRRVVLSPANAVHTASLAKRELCDEDDLAAGPVVTPALRRAASAGRQRQRQQWRRSRWRPLSPLVTLSRSPCGSQRYCGPQRYAMWP